MGRDMGRCEAWAGLEQLRESCRVAGLPGVGVVLVSRQICVGLSTIFKFRSVIGTQWS